MLRRGSRKTIFCGTVQAVPTRFLPIEYNRPHWPPANQFWLTVSRRRPERIAAAPSPRFIRINRARLPIDRQHPISLAVALETRAIFHGVPDQFVHPRDEIHRVIARIPLAVQVD